MTIKVLQTTTKNRGENKEPPPPLTPRPRGGVRSSVRLDGSFMLGDRLFFCATAPKRLSLLLCDSVRLSTTCRVLCCVERLCTTCRVLCCVERVSTTDRVLCCVERLPTTNRVICCVERLSTTCRFFRYCDTEYEAVHDRSNPSFL